MGGFTNPYVFHFDLATPNFPSPKMNGILNFVSVGEGVVAGVGVGVELGTSEPLD